jgi:hypothetical protein
MKNDEADDNGLHEKENGAELMISLVSRDRSRHEAGRVEDATDDT